MQSVSSQLLPGDVFVVATNHGGHTPEAWGRLAANRIISVGDQSHPAIRDQAIAFRAQIEKVVAHYVQQALEQDRALRVHA